MATHIKTVLGEFLKKKKQDIGYQERIKKVVAVNIDKKIKKNVHLKTIDKNKLVFNCEGPSFAYVFNLQKDKLLKAVQQEFPEIDGIKTIVG